MFQPKNMAAPLLPPQSAAAIHATGLGKRFDRTGAAVLHDLELELPAGQMSLIKGPSGCGKSTLLAIMAGLTPPDSGKVTVLGEDLWAMRQVARDAFRLRNLGFIFQGSILFPALTGVEQITLVLGHMGMPAAEAQSRALQALAEVGLSHRADMRPAAMSGGERQRVAVACALAKRPALIFADEPTSALDTGSADAVGTLLREAAQAHGATVVCVTHDDRLSAYAGRILHMNAGRIAGIETQDTDA